eukprot:m.15177 g.15177  ORF g.15177 m.15177 type:complete len:440 (+) comp7796_c0_seq2:248-1567(+)
MNAEADDLINRTELETAKDEPVTSSAPSFSTQHHDKETAPTEKGTTQTEAVPLEQHEPTIPQQPLSRVWLPTWMMTEQVMVEWLRYYEMQMLKVATKTTYKIHQVPISVQDEEHVINTLTTSCCPHHWQLPSEEQKTMMHQETSTTSASIGPGDGCTQPEKEKMHLVLLHGMGGGLGIWGPILDMLSSRYRVHALDLIGFAASSRPAFPSDDMDALEAVFVDALEAWREAVGIQRFVLVGHSFGAYVASLYALKHPHRLHHLVLGDSWGYTKRTANSAPIFKRSLFFKLLVHIAWSMPPFAIFRAVGPTLGPYIMNYFKPYLGAKLRHVIDPDHIYGYLYFCNAASPSGERAFQYLCDKEGWARRPLVDRFHAMDKKLPVLFLAGAESWVKPDTAFELKSQHPHHNLKVEVIKHAGHWIQWDNPTAVAERINQIVTELD